MRIMYRCSRILDMAQVCRVYTVHVQMYLYVTTGAFFNRHVLRILMYTVRAPLPHCKHRLPRYLE